MIITDQYPLQSEMRWFELEVVAPGTPAKLMTLRMQPTLLEKIKERQVADEKLQKVRSDVEGGNAKDFAVDSVRILRFQVVCVYPMTRTFVR